VQIPKFDAKPYP